jgi:PAS domain S-box-containing protein
MRILLVELESFPWEDASVVLPQDQVLRCDRRELERHLRDLKTPCILVIGAEIPMEFLDRFLGARTFAPCYVVRIGGEEDELTDVVMDPADSIGHWKRALASGRRWLARLTNGLDDRRNHMDFLEQVQEMASIGQWEFDFASGKVWATEGALRIYGLEAGEFLISQVQSQVLPEYRSSLDRAIAGLKSGGTGYDEVFRIFRKCDGQIRDVRSIARYDAARDRLYGINQDLTDLRRNQDRLFESENKYRLLLEQMTDVVWQIDSDLTYTYISPSDFAMRGFLPQDVLGKNLLDFVVADSSQELWTAIHRRRKLTKQGVRLPPLRMDVEQIRRDGGAVWTEMVSTPIYDSHGELTGFLGMSRDLSQRRLAEQALSEERETLAVTLQSIGDGVITTDIHGRVTMMNSAAEQLTGRDAESSVGNLLEQVFRICDEFSHHDVRAPVEQALQQGHVVELPGNVLLLSGDGREMTISVSAAPIRDFDGEIQGVVLVFKDTTERQRMLESLQRTQKLDSLGVLAGGIAHDFNNLLLGIFGHLDLAHSHSAGNASAMGHIERAMEAFERARGLTQQLLTFSKGGAPIRRTGHLEPLIRNATQFALSGSSCICHYDIAEDLWPCDFDDNQLAQVIDNLVLNAVHAMPQGGMLEISACNRELGEAEHPMLAAGTYLRITVRDHGHGIPREIRKRIFEPFFTTKQKGSGLGLATSYSIVHRHEGCLDVESEPGEGTAFHILLPASGSQPDPHVLTNSSFVVDSAEGRILVMDDEEILLEILEEMLGALGFEVTSARNAQEAIAAFDQAQRDGLPFFAALLDLTIPGGPGGREVITHLRPRQPGLLAIATSGYSDDPVMADPVGHQFDASLPKPYRLQDLKLLLKEVRQMIPSIEH